MAVGLDIKAANLNVGARGTLLGVAATITTTAVILFLFIHVVMLLAAINHLKTNSVLTKTDNHIL